MSKSHYHITCRCNSEELAMLGKVIKAKATSIDLYNNKQAQTDRMLTKYNRDLNKLRLIAQKDINKLQDLGFEVVRLKIEEVVGTFTELDVGKYDYLEGHIKVSSDKPLSDIDGFILSGNNQKTNTRFYNFRIRSVEDYNKVFGNLHLIQNELEREFERVVYDSNVNHDRWWG